MKNTTGLYKHQRDNRGKRRKLPASDPKARLVPVQKYEYKKAREQQAQNVTVPDDEIGENQRTENERDDIGQR